MFEYEVLFYKLFSSSKIVGALKDIFCRFCYFLPLLNGGAGSFRGQSNHLITSTNVIQSLHLWALLCPNMDITDGQTFTKNH